MSDGEFGLRVGAVLREIEILEDALLPALELRLGAAAPRPGLARITTTRSLADI